eukprot:comp23098_c0_seq1/m.37107 comp23098_c0_seq1/g.37107  ORF comp23098_c0_seq1/g.37107 comp23098_c0_seq1/m.37107 type:complete len:329 (-) comp23098_c0_seq1:733-1719(-)
MLASASTLTRVWGNTPHILARTMSSASANAAKKVGFIGLGNMGGHMAANLLKAGHSVTVYDIFPEATSKLAKQGAGVAECVAEIAQKSDAIITMLPSSPHVLGVYDIEQGLLNQSKEGTLLIDASTIHPGVARQVGSKAKERGLHFVDAPVSGGVGGAQNATLTFMVGGTKTAFDLAKPFLQTMGKNIVYCGAIGNGQAAKICNNMLLGISMVGVSEAMNLGIKLGLDKETLAGIINTSSGRCWSSDTYNPVPGVMPNVPASRNYEGGFGSALMLKDLGLASGAAHDVKASIPLGALAQQIYTTMCAHGYANKDFGAVYEFLAGATKK